MITKSALLAISTFLNFFTIAHIKQLESSDSDSARTKTNALSTFLTSTLSLWYVFIGMQIMNVQIPDVVRFFAIVLVVTFDAAMYMYTKDKLARGASAASVYTNALYFYHALNLLAFGVAVCALTVVYIFRGNK
jgi:hypothetical protein